MRKSSLRYLLVSFRDWHLTPAIMKLLPIIAIIYLLFAAQAAAGSKKEKSIKLRTSAKNKKQGKSASLRMPLLLNNNPSKNVLNSVSSSSKSQMKLEELDKTQLLNIINIMAISNNDMLAKITSQIDALSKIPARKIAFEDLTKKEEKLQQNPAFSGMFPGSNSPPRINDAPVLLKLPTTNFEKSGSSSSSESESSSSSSSSESSESDESSSWNSSLERQDRPPVTVSQLVNRPPTSNNPSLGSENSSSSSSSS
ncbi:sericin-2-like [Neocloeon triangulifer]|uniref:sericin-2-like n=1 Tax=Neocloeon triangulifer TaxID=2078957 RepID=UPI00286F2E7A|nr:sericin-2-like [Neocloeon triangulifer]